MEATFSYFYSLPYIFLFLLYFVLFLMEKKSIENGKSTLYIRLICMSLFFFFFGLRGYLDTDFTVYYPVFEETPVIRNWRGVIDFFSYNSSFSVSKMEPGFKVFLIFLKSISSDYIIVQIASTLINLFLLNYFFKKYSNYYALGFVLFLLFSGVIFEINLLRNSKSILIFIYSLQFIKERKLVKYCLCILVGLLFHSSAIFYLPLYFFLHKKISNKLVWSVFAVGNIIFLLQIHYLGPIVSFLASKIGEPYSTLVEIYTTLDLYNQGYGITIGYLERILTFVLLFYNRKKLEETFPDDRTLNMFLNSYFIYFISYTFLSEYSIFIDRITMLFVFSYWILYSYLYESLKFKSLFLTLLFMFSILKVGKSNNFITRKYENVLWGIQSLYEAQTRLNIHIDDILKND